MLPLRELSIISGGHQTGHNTLRYGTNYICIIEDAEFIGLHFQEMAIQASIAKYYYKMVRFFLT